MGTDVQVHLFNEEFIDINELTFPKLSSYSSILKNREYKQVPLPDIPVSSIATRSVTRYIRYTNTRATRGDKDSSPSSDIDGVYLMMNDRVSAYIDYLIKLKESLQRRFSC